MPSLLDLLKRVIREGQQRKAQPKPAPPEPREMTEDEREFLQALHEGSAQESQERQEAAPPESERERFLAGEWVETPQSSNVGRIHFDPNSGVLMIGFKHRDTDEKSYYGYGPVDPDFALQLYDAASKGRDVWDRIRVRGTTDGHQIPYWFISGPPGKNQKHVTARRQRRRRR